MALAVYPLVVNLPPNPVWIWWQWREGSAPMSPEAANRLEIAGRWMLFVVEAFVAGLVLVLMRRYSVFAVHVGFIPEHWKFRMLVGCAAGLLWVGLQMALLRVFGRHAPDPIGDYYKKGAATFWVSLFLFVAFAEELWRAFCLFALANRGHSVLVSVIATAVAFGVGHLRFGAPQAFGATMFGFGLALLFKWQGSLVATSSAHLVANLGALYRMRRVARRLGGSFAPD